MKTVLSASIVALFAAAPAIAAPFYEDFEGAPPAGFTRTTGAEAGGTTAIVPSGDVSHGNVVAIDMPDVDNGYGRVTLNSPTNQPIGKLRDVSVTFDTFINNSSEVVLTPYILLGLDNNGDGQYDSNTESLVIQFSSQIAGPISKGQWYTDTLDGNNDVHVQVDRGMLAGDAYQPDSSPDKLADLFDLNYNGSTLWGDLNVFRVRAAAGFFNAGPGDQGYSALVDNINAIPEPTSLAVLGLGSAALLLRRRRAAK